MRYNTSCNMQPDEPAFWVCVVLGVLAILGVLATGAYLCHS